MRKTLRAVFGNSLIQFSLFLLLVSTINFLGIPPLMVILTAVLVAPLGIGLYRFRRQQKPADEQAESSDLTFFFILLWLIFVVMLFVRWPR